MPDSSFPGVFVEETPFKSRSIEGVSTSTAGFVGPTRFGPVETQPHVVTSLSEFERVYGNGQQLEFEGAGEIINYQWHAARAFFEEGGKRLYIARTFRPLQSDNTQTTYQRPREFISECDSNKVGDSYADGHARARLSLVSYQNQETKSLLLRARFPGAAGNLVATIAIRLHENLLAGETGKLTAAGLSNYDTVWISNAALLDSTDHGDFYCARFSEQEQTWIFGKGVTGQTPDKNDWRLNTSASSGFRSLSRVADDYLAQVRVATVTISVASPDGGTYVWERIGPDPNYTNAQGPNSLSSCFAENLEGIRARVLPLVVLIGEELATGVDVVQTILGGAGAGERADTTQFERLDWLDDDTFSIRRTAELSGANDGQLPGVEEYLGRATEEDDLRTGLSSLEFVDEVSIVAAPGATAGYQNNSDRANAIIAGLVAHAERLRYRIAVIDSGDNQTMPEVRATRGLIDSKNAAFYYPWIRVLDPRTQTEISLPPSGFVAGIYARVDRERGVFKAPANEVVHGATGLEVNLDDARQEILNREGINCFRLFPDRSFRLFGARLASSDPEFKYVNVRRYIAYLEHSIDRGTHWAVFEPNGEILWANVRSAIEGFLQVQWKSGALMEVKPEEAYFVKCDRSTMTQADIESGRLICLIGIAPVRPAEFVIFRIGQWTASRTDP